MNFTKKSLEILKSFRSKKNIRSVANQFNTTYNIIRNNYFKFFWRQGYLNRVGYGLYITSNKGNEKIKDIKISYKINNFILIMAKKGESNKKIISVIHERYNKNLSNSTIYSRVYRIKTIYKFPIDRRKVNCILPQNFSIKLAELIGLIFSDGCINRDGISFYNKDTALLDRFQYLVSKVFNLNKPYKRERRPGFFEINYYSMDMFHFLYKLTSNKSLIPVQILKGSKDIKTSFLRGYFSGDGCIVLSIPHKKFYNKFQVYSFLFLACKKIKITKSIENIFSSLGYSVKVKSEGLDINKSRDLINFYNEIGFINNSKIADYSRNWKGFEKNQILKYTATKLKEDKKLHLLRYGERELVIKHIQNKLEKTISKKY